MQWAYLHKIAPLNAQEAKPNEKQKKENKCVHNLSEAKKKEMSKMIACNMQSHTLCGIGQWNSKHQPFIGQHEQKHLINESKSNASTAKHGHSGFPHSTMHHAIPNFNEFYGIEENFSNIISFKNFSANFYFLFSIRIETRRIR